MNAGQSARRPQDSLQRTRVARLSHPRPLKRPLKRTPRNVPLRWPNRAKKNCCSDSVSSVASLFNLRLAACGFADQPPPHRWHQQSRTEFTADERR